MYISAKHVQLFKDYSAYNYGLSNANEAFK